MIAIALALLLAGADMPRPTLADVMVGRAATVRPTPRRPLPLVPKAPGVKWVKGAPPGGWWDDDTPAAAAGDTIWYRPGADRWTRAHEMGHVYDEKLLTDSDRRRLTRVMRAKGEWVSDPETPSPSEYFSDWYANARLGQGPGFKRKTKHGLAESWNPGYGTQPVSPRAYRRFLKIVNRAYELQDERRARGLL